MNIKRKNHPFHIVDPSPWPFIIGISLLMLTIGIVLGFHGFNTGKEIMIIGIVSVITIMGIWWRDVIIEGTILGNHTERVKEGLNTGMLLFIISEIFFFVSIFWGFFHSSLIPAIQLGSEWPPKGIETLDAWGVPFFNTILLVTSSITVTMGHNNLIVGKEKETIKALIITIILVMIFSVFQIFEYYYCSFTISDSVLGSIFFMGTGFHGIHVIAGTIFVGIGLIRLLKGHYTTQSNCGLEYSIWYLHLVDLVWIILYIAIYIWGG
jgi:cytochrome c oxidase subunit 3